ncbi:hypothetical protein BJY52DRAFT_1323658 [Lactarius psammicola]|nr:hypothetical protein BJY52DRAFT_1323658 [Lactarius psammicola]
MVEWESARVYRESVSSLLCRRGCTRTGAGAQVQFRLLSSCMCGRECDLTRGVGWVSNVKVQAHVLRPPTRPPPRLTLFIAVAIVAHPELLEKTPVSLGLLLAGARWHGDCIHGTAHVVGRGVGSAWDGAHGKGGRACMYAEKVCGLMHQYSVFTCVDSAP